MVITMVTQETMYTNNIMRELGKSKTPIVIYQDNTGSIFLSNNKKVSGHTKHIDVRYQFIRNAIYHKDITILHVEGVNNTSDQLNKNVTEKVFTHLTPKLLTGRIDFPRENVDLGDL